MVKEKISFSDDGVTVSYSERRSYKFNPDLSAGSEDDVVIVPNIPLFGAMNAVKSMGSYATKGFKDLIE